MPLCTASPSQFMIGRRPLRSSRIFQEHITECKAAFELDVSLPRREMHERRRYGQLQTWDDGKAPFPVVALCK
jgi:hypothetical protein